MQTLNQAIQSTTIPLLRGDDCCEIVEVSVSDKQSGAGKQIPMCMETDAAGRMNYFKGYLTQWL